MALFSKFKKCYTVETMDLDKDADDKADESEKSDNKEDYNGEEKFLIESHLLITTNTLLSYTVYFSDHQFQLSNRSIEISSPPPQA